eukprot:GHVT01010753.1.p1 GENE.GHVT01010753.1~~GHVT01010753.1.p1  ORF type:complete len:138 (+),score=5.15 GHVT01010753.1:778-1191(+)
MQATNDFALAPHDPPKMGASKNEWGATTVCFCPPPWTNPNKFQDGQVPIRWKVLATRPDASLALDRWRYCYSKLHAHTGQTGAQATKVKRLEMRLLFIPRLTIILVIAEASLVPIMQPCMLRFFPPVVVGRSYRWRV